MSPLRISLGCDCASDQLQVATYLPGSPIAMTDASDFTVALR
jgi:hypothetical protein